MPLSQPTITKTTSKLFLIITLIGLSRTKAAEQANEEFKPLTEDVTFKAIYKLKAFVNSQPDSVSEIQEFYQHNLELASIYRTNYWKLSDKVKPLMRHFFYSGQFAHDLELVEELGLGDTENIELYDDGSDPIIGYSQSNVSSAIVLNEASSLDGVLLRLRTCPIELNLDSFMSAKCLAKVNSKLSYIRGLSRILHLIECNRASLIYGNPLDGPSTVSSHGGRTRTFVAKGLNSNDNQNLRLDLSVDVAEESLEGISANADNSLPSRIKPLSVTLVFKPNLVTLKVDLFQLEMIKTIQLLGSTLTGHLMLPSGLSLPDEQALLVGDKKDLSQVEGEKTSHQVDQFSLRGSLTGKFASLNDPIELEVVYDGQSRLLARKMSRIDRSASVGDAWRRHTTRLVYDGHAKLKYSIIVDHDDYNYDPEYRDQEYLHKWRTCSSNKLTNIEHHELETGDIDVFDLKGAVFLGMTLVRGIPCYVYERRIFSLPFWLGAGDQQDGTPIYATIYESANELDMSSYLQERRQRDRAEQLSKLVRVEINQVPLVDKDKRQLLFALDLHDFEWSLRMVNAPQLFDIGQDCLFLHPTVQHIEVELEYEVDKSVEYGEGYAEQLKPSKQLLAQSTTMMVSKFIDVSPLQLIDLETEFITRHNSRLQVKLSMYDRPNHMLVTAYVGQAEDLSVGYPSRGSWSIGATSLSLEDCEWRAAHALDTRHGSSISFMYCPGRSHCVLSDKRWPDMNDDEPFTVSGVLKYLVNGPNDGSSNLCSIFMTTEMQQEPADPSGDMRIYWLLGQQSKLLDKRMELKYEKEASLWLKLVDIKLSNPIEEHRQFKSLRGVSYDDNFDNIAPLMVSDLAHCADTCRILHNCASYSVCHHEHQLECIFTKVNWTDPAKIELLRSFIKPTIHIQQLTTGSNHSSSGSLILRLDSELKETEVELKRSRLCSIHTRQHLDTFILGQIPRPPSGERSSGALVLRAKTADECAQFCLERAQVLRDLNSLNMSEENRDQVWSNREYSCVSFRFRMMTSSCELLPSLKVSLMSNMADLDSARGRRWRAAMSDVNENSTNSPGNFYTLDYERLFVGHQGEQLILVDGQESGRSEWQSKLFDKTSLDDCARLCLARHGCRSFDLLAPSGVTSLGHCILNNLAILDIGLNEGTKVDVPLKVSSEWCKQSIVCWHYEPSELALFVMSDGDRLVGGQSGNHLRLLAPGDYETHGIFISYKPSSRAYKQQEAMAEPTTEHKQSQTITKRTLIGMLIALAGALFLAAYIVRASHGSNKSQPFRANKRQTTLNLGDETAADVNGWLSGNTSLRSLGARLLAYWPSDIRDRRGSRLVVEHQLETL